jgi:hypothetical protein
MDKLGVPKSKPDLHGPSSTSKKPISLFRRYWDLLAVVLLVLASMPATLLSPITLRVVQRPGLFDDSWVLDTSFKAYSGLWFGRDVAFDYGPLYQWLTSAPSRWMGFSMGSLYDTFNTFPLWFGFVLSYLTLRLLLPEQPAWKRFLLLLLLSVFWSPFDVRSPFAIFLFAVAVRGCYAVCDGWLKPVVFGGSAAILCALAFLNNADTGVYGIVALLVSLIGVAWESRRTTQWVRLYASVLLTFAVVFAVAMVVINCFMATAFDFRFWKGVRAFIGGYRWNAAWSMSPADGKQLLCLVMVGLAIFLVRWFASGERNSVLAARTGFLLSAAAFVFVTLQSGLVRSDINHIHYAIFPLMFLSGIVLFSFRSRTVSAVAVAFAIVCSLVFSAPKFRRSTIESRYDQVQHPVTSCPSGFAEFDRACFPSQFTNRLQVASSYIQAHSGERDSIVVFPYQYLYALASRHNFAQGVEQTFLAADPFLKNLNVAGLEQSTAPVGLYFPDGPPDELSDAELSSPIDGVPNLTRNPEVWFWLFHHYQAPEQLRPGMFAVRRDNSRSGKLAMEVTPLIFATQTYPIRDRDTVIDLGAPVWPLQPTDFLRLRLNVRYGYLWKLRKPERMQLEITRADGSRTLKAFVLAPNVSTDVWFYPWTETDLTNYFDADEGRWRQGDRPAITQLRILITPLDWISQQPESVAVEAVDAVRFSLNH